MKQVLLFFTLLATGVTQVFADKTVMELGIHGGGDELAEVSFTAGYTSNVTAGGLVSFNIGSAFDISPSVEAQITFGIKVDDVTAANGSVSFTRYPVNFMLYYKSYDWNIGVGATYHINPTLDGSGITAGLRANFDDALGGMFDMMYFYAPESYIAFRYTIIEYDTIPTVTTTSTPVNGNSFGIVFGGRF